MKTLSLAVLVLLTATAALAGVTPGQKAVDFKLTDTAGVEHSLQEYLADGKVVVLEWFNPDCPFIKKHHKRHQTMNTTFAKYAKQGMVWLAINSGAAGKQGAGLERNQRAAKEYGLPFPVLMDPEGKVGKAYGAKTTPHMFVVAPNGKVIYAGAIDNDRSADTPGNTNHLAEALDAVFAGRAVEVAETRPYGCSVKY